MTTTSSSRDALHRVPAQLSADGYLAPYLCGIVEQWLLVAPLANPAMLEMMRDRDTSPLRALVPWAGEFAGKYLTSAVEVLRLTNDERLRKWLGEWVEQLLLLQAEDGYLGAWSQEFRLTNRSAEHQTHENATWDTWSHYHVMLGLLLWHEESGEPRSLAAARRIGDALCEKYLGDCSPRLVETGNTEMNLAPAHGLCLLYQATGEERYLALARQIVGEFDAMEDGVPLAGDYLEGALAGKEFWQLPRPRWESLHPIMALVELFRISGEEKYRTAFENLWWSIVGGDRHNTGGFSSGEQATGNPYDGAAIETCCTIAWMAMSVEMLKLSGDSRVADELEMSLLNSVVGMHSYTGRFATYDTPMDGVRCASAHSIVFQAREGSPELNCCSVNSPRGLGLLSQWALMGDDDGLVLNYYGAGKLQAQFGERSVTLVQQTDYPSEGEVRIVVEGEGEFTLKLRIPHWSRQTRIRVNGEEISEINPGSYCALRRSWQQGDIIEVEFDFALRFWRGERDREGYVSLYRGPLLLAFDRRYNAHLKLPDSVRGAEKWMDVFREQLPQMDANALHPRIIEWDAWLPPYLLLEVEANGQKVHLCDYGNAGETGTPYVSWLRIQNSPGAAFSRDNPSRTAFV